MSEPPHEEIDPATPLTERNNRKNSESNPKASSNATAMKELDSSRTSSPLSTLPISNTHPDGEKHPHAKSEPVLRKGHSDGTNFDWLSDGFVGELEIQRDKPKLKRGESILNKNAYQREKIFLLDLALAMHQNGAPAFRTEAKVSAAAYALGLVGDCFIFLTTIMVSFNDFDLNPANSDTHILRANSGLDAYKLDSVDQLGTEVALQMTSLDEAIEKLDEILKTKEIFPIWAQLIAFVFGSAGSSLLFFNGGWEEAVASAIVGFIVGLLNCFATSKVLANMLELLAAFICAFLLRLTISFLPSDYQICFSESALAALVWLLPGLRITTSVLELSYKHFITGTARLVSALLISFQLGFGLAIGDQVVFWDRDATLKTCDTSTLDWWWMIPLFFVVTLSFIVLLQAKLRQFPAMVVVSAAGFIVYQTSSLYFDGTSSTTLSALAIGLCSSIYEKFTHKTSVILSVNGILLLVPGSLGVRSFYSSLDGNVVSGISFGLQVLTTAIAITVGLFGATFLAQLVPKFLRRKIKSTIFKGHTKLFKFSDLYMNPFRRVKEFRISKSAIHTPHPDSHHHVTHSV